MGQTILIAEDEPSLLKLLTRKVTSLGYTVSTATDGEAALNKIKSENIDLILLDIIMPRKNGLQVLQELRVNLHSKVPVIVLSNLEKPEDIDAGKAYGVKAYIIKSQISMRQLALEIADALKESKS